MPESAPAIPAAGLPPVTPDVDARLAPPAEAGSATEPVVPDQGVDETPVAEGAAEPLTAEGAPNLAEVGERQLAVARAAGRAALRMTAHLSLTALHAIPGIGLVSFIPRVRRFIAPDVQLTTRTQRIAAATATAAGLPVLGLMQAGHDARRIWNLDRAERATSRAYRESRRRGGSVTEAPADDPANPQ